MIGRPESPVIFLHIPRSAGTTFKQILRRQYRKGRVLDTQLLMEKEIEGFRALPHAERAQIDVLGGHMTFGAHELLPRRARYITFLRDPVSRVASYYKYVSQRTTEPPGDVIARDKLSLVDFVTSGIARGHTENGATRMLSGSAFPASTAASEELLDQAKTNLESHFAAFGLTERFDDSLVIFKRTLGWIRPLVYERRNITGGGEAPLTQRERTTLRAANELDLDLYDFALALFERRQRNVSFFALRSVAFRASNRVASPALSALMSLHARRRASRPKSASD